MLISKLQLQNWRNFKHIEVDLRDRVFIIGSNASGKSNLLDVFRFLRDIAKPGSGGLQGAVMERNGMTKLRSLLARKNPVVSIMVELSHKVDEPPAWRYSLSIKSEGKGQQRVIVHSEKTEDLKNSKLVFERPNDEDRADPERLTETNLEQVNANKDFREVAQFFSSLTYLHLVPQLLKHGELGHGSQLAHDPFGQSFLERIAKTPDRTRNIRLQKIEAALKACVPNMRDLRFERDPATGTPHLSALYKHWRPDAGWQREDQFSDGTLRLLGIMWSLLDGDSLLLLEEPELSLNEAIVRQIPPLLWQMRRKSKHQRQVFVTTHSEALLTHPSIEPRDVVRLKLTPDGTVVDPASREELELVEAGYTVAEVMVKKIDPAQAEQLSIL